MVNLVQWMQRRPWVQFGEVEEDEEFQLPAAADLIAWDKVE